MVPWQHCFSSWGGPVLLSQHSLVAGEAFGGPGVNHEGAHFRVENGGLPEPLAVRPTIYFGGASKAAERVAAKHADVVLLWGETPSMVRDRIASVRPGDGSSSA
ncbi:LLM class flavin-dependent oxidoreductase [Sorangium sp. So ce542]|uniref:LLM class flavin-dependent oxidoreductase n=1 Tax=Sorangium sp. So ce542 TaxID=3133316 RepID=UPI003F62E6FE